MSEESDPIAVLANQPGNETAGENAPASEAGKWVDQLSKEYRTDESLKGKAKLDDLFKDYKDRGTKIADMESKVKAFEAPKDASEYELQGELVGKLGLSKETQDTYRKTFMEAGLPKELAKTVFESLAKYGLELKQSSQEAKAKADAAAEAEIQKDWGKDHATNMDTVRTAVSKLFPVETMKKMEAAGLMKDKGFLNGLLPVGRSVSEGKFIKGGTSEEAKNPLDSFYSSMNKK